MILVLNSGSSSIKFKLFDLKLKNLFGGVIQEIEDFYGAFEKIFTQLIDLNHIKTLNDIAIIGHRVVHGGEYFTKATLIDDEVIGLIDSISSLAPLHNPSNLDGIKIAINKIPHARQVAVFDTAFHQTIPQVAYIYPIPLELYEKHNIRRYGFHGTSHKFVANECAKYLKTPLEKLNLITIHLGNGDSITAIKNGQSIDTSMGFSPLEGLMMGTRAGDIDSEIIIYLENQLGMDSDEVDRLLNKQSGFLGICGKSDLRMIKEDAKKGDLNASLAIDMFCYRVKKYLGSYKEILGAVDCIVFTGGIGENAPYIRKKIIPNIDDEKNNNCINISEIQNTKSKEKILVIPTNEEYQIAKECLEFMD